MRSPQNSLLHLILLAAFGRGEVCDNATLHDKKVIGWRLAKPGEFPFAASLQWTFGAIRHFCGASLARPNVALTACHCMMIRSDFDNSIFLADPKDRILVAGSINNNLSDPKFPSRVAVKISSFKAHPLCRFYESNDTDVPHGGWDYDMGLAHLEKNLTFDGVSLGPFHLPSFDPEELRKDMMYKMVKQITCEVIGWGRRRVRQRRDADPRLLWSELTVITVKLQDFAACYNILCGYHKLYCDIDPYARRQVCATTLGDFEVCQGDSGGPLLCGEKHYLYGTVGWGPNCGEDKGVPSVYATVYDGWEFIIASLGERPHQRNLKVPQILSLPVAMLTTLHFWL